MCQGLPCIGATVRLRRAVQVGRDRVPANSTGEVVQEHIATRELSLAVSSGGKSIVVRVSEDFVEVISRE